MNVIEKQIWRFSTSDTLNGWNWQHPQRQSQYFNWRHQQGDPYKDTGWISY